MAKFSLKLTKRYLRDLKLARKRGMDESLLNEIIGKLLNDEPLPAKNHDYCVSFQTITGFTYERVHEYELLVKRTTLANPPQDSGKYRYELVRIVSDKENGKA